MPQILPCFESLCIDGLKSIFKPGIEYKKQGYTIGTNAFGSQTNHFVRAGYVKTQCMMQTLTKLTALWPTPNEAGQSGFKTNLEDETGASLNRFTTKSTKSSESNE